MPRQEDFRVAVDNEVALNRQSDASRKLRIRADIMVYGLILSLGALQFGLSQRSDEFFSGDTTYFELARSIIEKRSYEFIYRPETTFPPGFPAILALLCVTVGCKYVVLLRSMAVFATLGLLVSYQLLRREQGRAVAVISCLLLASSPFLFQLSTRWVFSDLPYFFTSMATLWLAARLDTAKNPRARPVLGLLCGVLLVSSLLIRSSGVALLTGLVGWLATAWWCGDRRDAKRRLKTFFLILLLGIVVQGLWMEWASKREVHEWPMVGGYPQSYVSQLKVKSGNQPELGAASLGDIPPRVVQNLADRAAALMELVTRKDWINPAWFSPLVFGPVLLILAGVGSSIRRGGGGVAEWYFISHEAMYLLWPWNFEMRFLLPVAPLACLYLWRGGEALLGMAVRKERAVGVWGLFVAVPLGVYASVSGWGSGSVQPKLAAIFWALAAIAFAKVVWMGSYRLPPALNRRLLGSEIVVSVWGKSLTLRQVIGVVTVALLVGTGIAQQVSIGRENLSFDVTKQPNYPDIVAAQWIQSHTASTAVVMARQLHVVYHYSRRKVVWFPPLSDPRLLIEGMRKHKVDFVIVVSRNASYWLPPDQDCFEPVFKREPAAFRLVHEGPRYRIFTVVRDSLFGVPATPG